MAFTVNHIKRLLKNYSVSELRNAQSAIFDRLKKALLLTKRKPYKFFIATKTVKREILVKQDAPDVIEIALALR